MADHLHSDGFLAAGYEYVAIDDCWPEKQRDKDGKLQPDHTRFPSGFKALGDYVSNKGPGQKEFESKNVNSVLSTSINIVCGYHNMF